VPTHQFADSALDAISLLHQAFIEPCIENATSP
jgi:hypothetical protein